MRTANYDMEGNAYFGATALLALLAIWSMSWMVGTITILAGISTIVINYVRYKKYTRKDPPQKNKSHERTISENN